MTVQPNRIVVIGCGLAGLNVAERLRARGFAGSLTLLGAEGAPPVDRPPLSKEVLRGEVARTQLRSAGELRGLEVDLRVDEAAEHLDTAQRLVRTSTGTHAFDIAVIATGATPRRVRGLDGLVLRTMNDAARLRASLVSGGRVGIVGAGLIGCEVAASSRALGLDVVLHDVATAPMIRVLGPAVAEVIAELHRDNGVRLRLGASVGRDDIDAETIVEAVGTRPEVDWLAGSGLAVEDGVRCDGDGLAAEGVYAVGDVANWDGHRSEHWTAATRQADHVAACITGQAVPAAEPAYWWSDQYGLRIQGLGSPAAGDTPHLLTWGPRERTVALYSHDGRLTGAVGFGAPAAVMRLGGHILRGADVGLALEALSAPRPARAGTT